MIIRRMEEEDLPQVADIEADLFGDPWSESDFRDSLKQPEAGFLTAEDQDKGIVGYCGGYRALDEVEIVNVAVRRDCQNGGIGCRMVDRLVRDYILEGVHYFILEVRMSNLAAQHVYEKLGFRKIGVRKGFYDSPVEDAVIMQKEKITADE